MSTAFLYGASSGESGLPTLSMEKLSTNEYIQNKTFTLNHEKRRLFIITVGHDGNDFAHEFQIDGVSFRNTGYDGHYVTGSTFCATGFILSVKKSDGTYDLCRLDGTVIRGGVTSFIVKSNSRGLYVTGVDAL